MQSRRGAAHYAKILDIPVRRGIMAALCSMSNGCARAAHCWGMRAVLILPCAVEGKFPRRSDIAHVEHRAAQVLAKRRIRRIRHLERSKVYIRSSEVCE